MTENTDQDELYIHRTIQIDKRQEPLRIDKFLLNRLENVSRNKIQNSIAAGNVLVNNQPIKNNYKIKPDDTITIVMAEPPVNHFLKPENIPLNIIYEDDDLAIVNKPPGLVVHPGVGNYTGTLVNALLYHFLKQKTKGEVVLADKYTDEQVQVFNTVRPFLVHRIDKNTSGLLVIGKNELAMEYLSNQFFHHTIERKYIALVWGDLKENSGTITGNIGRSPRDRQKFCVLEDPEQGKHAVTHYRVLERMGYVNLIECKLETGRTHQIRVHMSHIGHPVFSDDTYGGDKIVKGTIYNKYKQFVENCFTVCNRQALHAKSLGFIHPSTKKELFFESELPEDMQSSIEKWRVYMSEMRK